MPLTSTDLVMKAGNSRVAPGREHALRGMRQGRRKEAKNAYRRIRRNKPDQEQYSSVAFRPRCSPECMKGSTSVAFDERTDACKSEHADDELIGSSSRHASTTQKWATLFLADFNHGSVKPKKGSRGTLQVILTTTRESGELLRKLEEGPIEEAVNIVPDGLVYNLVNQEMETLMTKILSKDFQISRGSGTAPKNGGNGGHGLYVDFDKKARKSLKEAIAKEGGKLHKLIKDNGLVLKKARGLLADMTESLFCWHFDSSNVIPRKAVVLHLNWMFSLDYCPGILPRRWEEISSVYNEDQSANSTIRKVLDRPQFMRVKYLCGPDIVAFDFKCEGGRGEAYLRLWDVEGDEAEVDGLGVSRCLK